MSIHYTKVAGRGGNADVRDFGAAKANKTWFFFKSEITPKNNVRKPKITINASFYKNGTADLGIANLFRENQAVFIIDNTIIKEIYKILVDKYSSLIDSFIAEKPLARAIPATLQKVLTNYTGPNNLDKWLNSESFDRDVYLYRYLPFLPGSHPAPPRVAGQNGEEPQIKPEETKNQPEKPSMKLNTILYGPPGTGKTFSTTALALNVFIDRELMHLDGASLNKAQLSELRNSAANIVGEGGNSQPDEETWRAWTQAFQKLQNDGRIIFTTFHQNYSYEDFIEGLRADTNGNNLSYRYERGIFKRLCLQALDAWLNNQHNKILFDTDQTDNETLRTRLNKIADDAQCRINGAEKKYPGSTLPYVLIIDEINRGNIARIFGELITLIEESKRACAGGDITSGRQPLWATLPYTRDKLIVPPNLYLLGTMNTADRSLVGLDVALRRRFSFIAMRPQHELLPKAVNADNGEPSVNVADLLRVINDRIVKYYDEDHEIGHAYFLGVDKMSDLKSTMLNKVLPQLREYFHDDLDKIVAILATENHNRSALVSNDGNRLLVVPDAFENPYNYRSLIELGSPPNGQRP
jgi:adenylate kinase family enzyme